MRCDVVAKIFERSRREVIVNALDFLKANDVGALLAQVGERGL